MTSLEKLMKHFERFPGVGGRQARRFAFHLLTEPREDLEEFAELVKTIRSTVVECTSCFRFFAQNANSAQCSICTNTLRDHTKLMIVERDSDIDALERSRMYDGLYFVLGGTVPLLESIETQKLRGGVLKYTVEQRLNDGLKEIILAFSVNPDGENTTRYIHTLIRELINEKQTRVSELGRGLSTGSELEYADPETIKNALKNRS